MNTTLLRVALAANSAFSATTGLLLVSQPATLAEWLGVGGAVVTVAGAGLIGFALMVAGLAIAERPDPRLALAVSMADVAWVLGTLPLLALARPMRSGLVITFASDLVVLCLAIVQLIGIARLFRHPGPDGGHRVCIEVDAPVTSEALWPVVGDLAGISSHMSGLRRSVLRGGGPPALGAVRECESTGGQVWAERCTEWEPSSKRFAVEFLADEPSFPYPFRSMAGGWVLVPRASECTLRVWWSVTPHRWWELPLVLPIMEARVRRDFPSVVASMAKAAGAAGRPTTVPRLASVC